MRCPTLWLFGACLATTLAGCGVKADPIPYLEAVRRAEKPAEAPAAPPSEPKSERGQ
jgi:hypothetical protein